VPWDARCAFDGRAFARGARSEGILDLGLYLCLALKLGPDHRSKRAFNENSPSRFLAAGARKIAPARVPAARRFYP
jgi:hypothetical protein